MDSIAKNSAISLFCFIASGARVRLAAIAAVLILVLPGMSTAFGGAFKLTNSDFQISTKDFETCDLPATKAQTQRVLTLSSIEHNVHIFELSNSSYCIVVTQLHSGARQSLAVSNYIFDSALVNDVIAPGVFVFSIKFRMNANQLGVTLINGKIVLSSQ
jgi:hypothetical protein